MPQSTLRYPLRAPSAVGNQLSDNRTESVDYVRFVRKRVNYKAKSNGSAFYGLNLPDNNVEFTFNPQMVYLAMPANLQTSYNPGYTTKDLGVGGMLAAGALGENALDPTSEGGTTQIVADLQAAARAALPEFANNAVAQIANSASGALGLAGSVDSNTLMQLSKGKVFNPYTEQLFNNMTFRSHQFSFKMFARDHKEADEIAKIVRYFKEGATPIIGDDANKFIEVPDKFDIKFCRLNPDSRKLSSSNDLHFRMHTSVCNGVSVNYTPDGQYNALKYAPLGSNPDEPLGLQVPVLTLGLSFLETRFIDQADILQGF